MTANRIGAFLLVVAIAGTSAPARGQALHLPDATPSPRIAALTARVARGDNAAVPAFWEEMARSTTPIIEPFPPDSAFILVTFVYRDTLHAQNILVSNGPAGWVEAFQQMAPIPGTDVWYKTVVLPRTVRVGYQFRVNDPPLIPWWADKHFGPRFSSWHGDRLNPRTDSAMRVLGARSIVVGPGADPQPWVAPRADVPRGHMDSLSITSGVLGHTRTFKVYTPAGFPDAAHRAGTVRAQPILVMFDGGPFTSSRSVPTPTILDNMIAAKKIQPVVAVFVANGAARMQELGCDSLFSAFVAKEVLPMVRQRYGIAADARTTVIGGSSHGGLAATCSAMRFPSVFGNVISQSGSYWWTPDPNGEEEWVSHQFIVRPKLPVRFYVEVGIFETDHGQGGGLGQVVTNRHFRDVLQARGYDVMYSEFPGSHEYFNWKGTLSAALTHFFPPANGR